MMGGPERAIAVPQWTLFAHKDSTRSIYVATDNVTLKTVRGSSVDDLLRAIGQPAPLYSPVSKTGSGHRRSI